MSFVFDVLCGLLLGFCYDILKSIRHQLKKPALTFLLDFMFWIFALGVCIFLFLLTGDRKFRFYELIGVSTGLLCYLWSFGGYFVGISRKIAYFLLFFFKLLFTSVKFFAIMIKTGVVFIGKPFSRLMRFGKIWSRQKLRIYKKHRKLMKRI